MFRRLTNVRLANAEAALHAGRWDEVVDALATADLATDRRARELLAQAFDPLFTRAQEHLLGGRFREALMDIERAARCGVHADRVADWRARAVNALDQFNRREQADRHVIQAAADRLAIGELTDAGAHIDRLPDGHAQRAAMMDEVSLRQDRAQRALHEAHAALRRDDLTAAVDAIAAARRDHASIEVRDAAVSILRRLLGRARETLASGQLLRARHDLSLARRVDGQSPELAELERAMNWTQAAATAAAHGAYDEAMILISKFSQLVPDGKWAAKTREHLSAIDSHVRAIAEGPLGLLTSDAQAKPTPVPHDLTLTGIGRAPMPPPHSPHPGRAVTSDLTKPPIIDAAGIPRRLILRIDGVGSYLLLRGDRQTIGRAGGNADLPLVSDLTDRQAEILRNGDDYFVIGTSGVEVGGMPVQRALLSPGDRLKLGRRVKMTFERPSRKSPTAILALAEGVRSVSDVRRVMLWTGPILLGPTTDCHIPLRTGMPAVVLLERGGALQLRPMPGAGNAATITGPITLALAQTIDIGGLRLALHAAEGC